MLKATLRSEGASRRPASSRRVYRESQAESSSLIAPVKQLASSVLPAGAFVVVTFGMVLLFSFSFATRKEYSILFPILRLSTF